MLRFLGSKANAKALADLMTDEFAMAYWGQSGEDAVLHRFFGNKRDGFYVDVGCHHPGRFSNTRLFHKYLGWRGLNIDANKDSIEKFNRERPNDTSVHALVGESTDRPIAFTVFKGEARSTADAKRALRLKDEGIEILSTSSMTPIPLRTLLDTYVPKDTSIDLMTVDIEGFDVQALKTNDWTKYSPTIVCVEDFEFKRGNSEIARYMIGVGYECVSHCYDTSIYKRLRA